MVTTAKTIGNLPVCLILRKNNDMILVNVGTH